MLAFSFLTICDRGVYGSWAEMIFIAAVEIMLLFGCLHKLADEVIIIFWLLFTPSLALCANTCLVLRLYIIF
jgi:hypothetical protein